MSIRDQFTQPVMPKQSVMSQILVRVISGVLTVLIIAAIAAILDI